MSNQPSNDSAIVRNRYVYAGVIFLAVAALAPIIWTLWRVLLDLFEKTDEKIQTNALRIGWSIVAAGFVIACMVILLRLKVRQEDERAPPLAPALAMVAVGAALVAVVSLAR